MSVVSSTVVIKEKWSCVTYSLKNSMLNEFFKDIASLKYQIGQWQTKNAGKNTAVGFAISTDSDETRKGVEAAVCQIVREDAELIQLLQGMSATFTIIGGTKAEASVFLRDPDGTLSRIVF